MCLPELCFEKRESMFRDGKGKRSSWLMIHFDRETEKQTIKDGEGRRERGGRESESRECSQALALEVFPCNVRSYCLHSAQIPLVMW